MPQESKPGKDQADPPHRYRAAGGVVLDEFGRVLLIERDVVRDGKILHEIRLPKGHIEPNETDDQAAMREVAEEAGYCDLVCTADLGQLTSDFTHRGQRIVRDDHFYLMRLKSDTITGNRCDAASEESLFTPRWAQDLTEAERLLSYEGEKQFARRAMNHLRT